jgi:UDP-glucose 4-epimerase
VKVVVTGAAGFIGSHLVEECQRRGWTVAAIDKRTGHDILDADLPALLRDASVVFHLAAQAGVRESWGQSFDIYTQQNVTVLQRLLEASRDAALDRFVFASSSSVYGDAETLPTPEDQVLKPVSPYGATKALGEHLTYLYFRSHGVPTVNLRYFSVYGPRQRPDMAFHRAIEAALDGEQFQLFGDGRQTRDFTYVEDIVQGTIAAAAHAPPGSTYNLGGGSRVSMVEALSVLDGRTGGRLRVTHAPNGHGEARDTAADISAAQRDLGYAPRWNLEDGLREQVAWHEAASAAPAV